MNFREENLRILSEKNPHFREELEKISPLELEPFRASSGEITAKRNGIYIHSRIDPVKEADRLIAASADSSTDTVIFFGFGLGYSVESFFRSFPAGRAVVLEPDTEFFLGVLGIRALSSLFKQERLILLIGVSPEKAAGVLHDYENDKIRVVRQRSTYPACEDYFRKIDDILSRMTSRGNINLNTLKRFGKLWIKNLSRNIDLIKTCPGIRPLENRFSGFPALVVAAGPSLDEILPVLPELRKRFLVIAVDTSYNACTGAGVEPDFVIVVDPQYWNTRHLDRAVQKKALLISESSTHPSVFRRLPGRIFLAGSIFPLGKYFEAEFETKGALGAGGSVATSAWDFARLIGCRPIVMAGLDLGFPKKNTHYKGSFFEDRSFFQALRFSPIETHSFRYLYEAEPRALPANDGSLTLTDKRMLIYQWWFETQMKLHPGVKTLTLSTGGIRIDGIEPVGMDKLLTFPSLRGSIDSVLEPCGSLRSLTTDDGLFERALSSLLEELGRIESLCREGILRIGRIRDEGDSHSLRAGLDALDEIDRRIMDIKLRDIAGFLMGPVLTALRETSDGPDINRVLENSEKVYRGLLESIDYHRSTLLSASKKYGSGKA